MDSIELIALVEKLDDNLDSLEDALLPLCKEALSHATEKLPLLDQAKLLVLIAYAIESVLFSFIRLSGSEAKEHPVYRELTRVKQYIDKIKEAESGSQKRGNLTLDKSALGRIIKHSLAGNT